MHLTKHARTRVQQRAIPMMLIDLLAQFGKIEAVGDGETKLFFDKAARRRVKAYAGPLAGILNEHLDVYAIVGPADEIITTGHLTKRVRHQ